MAFLPALHSRSFHALTFSGKVLHWGQLDGMSFAPFRPASSQTPLLAHPASAVNTPTLLQADMPQIRRMLSGRNQVVAQDEGGSLWTWANWAEVARIDSPWLTDRRSRLVDFAVGWDFSCALVETPEAGNLKGQGVVQEIWVWWQRFLSPSLMGAAFYDTQPRELPDYTKCYSFIPQAVRLPGPPSSALRQGDGSSSEYERFIKIVAGDHFLIGLTDLQRVYKLDLTIPPRRRVATTTASVEVEDNPEDGRLSTNRLLDMEEAIRSGRVAWTYLPKFSEHANRENLQKGIEQATSVHFISASFKAFFAIGNGTVLEGSADTAPEDEPIIRPELQQRNVVRCVFELVLDIGVLAACTMTKVT